MPHVGKKFIEIYLFPIYKGYVHLYNDVVTSI